MGANRALFSQLCSQLLCAASSASIDSCTVLHSVCLRVCSQLCCSPALKGAPTRFAARLAAAWFRKYFLRFFIPSAYHVYSSEQEVSMIFIAIGANRSCTAR